MTLGAPLGLLGLLAVPVLRAGLGLWQGAREVLPSAQVCHVGLQAGPADTPVSWYLDSLPPVIEERVGVLVFLPVLASGRTLVAVLERLETLGVSGPRLRVVTSLAAAPGLRLLGERFEDLTLYCACIDPDLDGEGRPLPGCGAIEERLYGCPQPGSLG